MSEHRATVSWELAQGDFRAGTYSREHRWSFDGGAVVSASPSPLVVREPMSNPAAVDPEEAFVASIASCHMLTFLHLAHKCGLCVVAYEDHAVGTMTKNERRVPWVSDVVLSPRIRWRDRAPSPEELERLHEEAHEQCFISNSVKTRVRIQQRIDHGA